MFNTGDRETDISLEKRVHMSTAHKLVRARKLADKTKYEGRRGRTFRSGRERKKREEGDSLMYASVIH